MARRVWASLAASVAAACVVFGCTTPATEAPAPPPPAAAADPAAGLDAFLSGVRAAPASAAAFTAYCDEALTRAAALRTALEAGAGADPLRAYDNLYLVLQSVGNDASVVQETNPSAEIRAAGEACTRRVTEAATGVELSRPIYDRLAALDANAASPAARQILTREIAAYRRIGVDKDEATRALVQRLQTEITDIGLRFARNIREDQTVIMLPNAAALEGLPADYIAAHPPQADGRIRITATNPDVTPILNYARRDATRRAVFMAYRNRAWPANEPVLRDLLQRRYQLAQTLGYANYAALITEDKMIRTPERAAAFIDQLSALSRPAAQRDYATLMQRLRRIDRRARTVPAWSSSYLSELVQNEDYALNSQEVRQYFAYNNVRDGIIGLTEELFGVDVRPWADAPRWHDSVGAYEVVDGGQVIGRFYLDMHPRPGKYSHAAMFPLRVGVTGRAVPVAALLCNFPAGDHRTGLMEHRDVETFLHEFGHLLHFMLSGRQDYAAANMGELEWDFIEAPSQLLEEWVWDYDTLARFAVDANGQTIPRDLVARMNRARTFGEALDVTTQLGYAAVSLNYYNRDPSGMSLDAVYQREFNRYATINAAPGTHMYAAFGHLDGYSAIYYTYQWSRAISYDLFTAFEASGLRDTATARRYRETVLAPGGSQPANALIERFLGRPTNVEAYARRLRQ